jgi:hypothetical protein
VAQHEGLAILSGRLDPSGEAEHQPGQRTLTRAGNREKVLESIVSPEEKASDTVLRANASLFPSSHADRQGLIAPSKSHEARVVPSGEKVTEWTARVWPRSVRSS